MLVDFDWCTVADEGTYPLTIQVVVGMRKCHIELCQTRGYRYDV